jgi:hypothetical protein
MKAKNIATVNNSFSELTRVSTRFLILGIVLIVLKGLNTLKVLKALKFTFDFDANRNITNSVVLKDINLFVNIYYLPSDYNDKVKNIPSISEICIFMKNKALS